MEHLIYLNLVSCQEVKAHYYLSRAFKCENISELQKSKLSIYKSIVEARLRINTKSRKKEPSFSKNPSKMSTHFILGDLSFFSEPVSDIESYNSLVVDYMKKNNSAFLEKLNSSEIRDKIFDFNAQCTPKLFEKHLLWGFHVMRSFSTKKTMSLLQSIFPNEKILLVNN